MFKKNIVFKFGGVAIGTEAEMWKKFRIILKHIDAYRKTHNIAIVVSAPAEKTRELIKTADSLNLTGANRDRVIGLGENITVNHFSAFLSQNNVQNESIIYPNYPIITDDNYGDANILEVKTDIISNAFQENKIVIVPGFVGQDENKNHTTIGLNGSDTTAIYLAKKLNAECIFFKDVNGIYPANPKKNSGLKPFKEVHYSDVLKQAEKTEQQILHPKGIKYAWENEIILWVKPIKGQGAGTCVSSKPQKRGVKNINGVYIIN
ncbi:MAG: amino acid kinase family protein [Alphaproteobacteria bacterium]|nr:MAG: hypothetical protein B6I23_02740 [Rickettsiaceae bacterium 4572_127]